MSTRSESRTSKALVAPGVALLFVGSFWGLVKAPGEVFMGDVQRIMYVHVPTAWNAMLTLTFAFCALFSLLTNAWKWDNRLEAAMEMGVVLSLLLCMQGAILFLWTGLVALRAREAALRLRSEIAPPLPEAVTEGKSATAGTPISEGAR